MDQGGGLPQLPGQDGQPQPQQCQQPQQPGIPQVPPQPIEPAPMAMICYTLNQNIQVSHRRMQRLIYFEQLIGWILKNLLQVKEYREFILH